MDNLDNSMSSTPDGKYKFKDRVRVPKSVKSVTMGYDVPVGDYYFQGYEPSDDSCFIAPRKGYIPKKGWKSGGVFAYNVKVSDLSPVVHPHMENPSEEIKLF